MRRGAEAGAGRSVAGGANALRGNLVDKRIDDAGTVVSQQVFAPHAVKLHIADAIAAADNRFVINLIGNAQARREVVWKSGWTRAR